MSVEATPVGNVCNIACSYCYQHPMRDADPILPAFDLEAMKRGIEATGAATLEDAERRGGGQVGFSVFGGEALLTPIAALEDLWSWGLKRYGQNGIQTNGTLITADHLAMFKRYRVSVGISIDGPGALNDARWAGSLERTRLMTAKTEAAIAACLAAGVTPSLIVTLSRHNASADRLPQLLAWFAAQRRAGIQSVNLHSLEVDHALVGEHLALTVEELTHAFRSLAAAQDVIGLQFDPFRHMAQLLLGDDSQASCVWHACDPYTTAAVQGVDGKGERTNCGRTNKEGISWRKPAAAAFHRQLALYQTPQADGGCQDCRFFLQCKGQCPGEGLDGDWRNRTDKCRVWFALFEDFERELITAGKMPLSLSPARPQIEQRAIAAWTAGQNPSLASLLSARSCGAGAVPDRPHGDTPHGDSHGDHTDQALADRQAAAAGVIA